MTNEEQRYRMFQFTIEAHNGQMYGEIPYCNHLRDVVVEVCQQAREEDQDLYATVAYGHDVLEDTDTTTWDLIDQGFSMEVVDAIEAITKRDYENRSAYLDRCMQNPIAKQVKIADTLCNLTQSVRDGNKRRVNKYTQQLNYLFKGE